MSMSKFTYRFVAVLPIVFIIAWEFFGLAKTQAAFTYTDLIRTMRFDPVAGPALIVTWTWLTFHFFFNPRWLGGSTGWRDLALYIPLGILFAFLATKFGSGFGGYGR